MSHEHRDIMMMDEEETFYGISSEILHAVSEALKTKDVDALQTHVLGLHAADMADLLQSLHADERHLLLSLLKNSLDPEILSELDEKIRQEVFELLGTEGLAAAVSELESDDAMGIIEDLEEDQQLEVLRSMPVEERAIYEEALAYPEKSAGRLMQNETVCVPPFWTLGEAMAFVRGAEDLPHHFYTFYVVDTHQRPLGEVSLSALLRHPASTLVSDVMQPHFSSIPVVKDQKEVAQLFRHYGLVSAPVIDAQDRIVGMITVDDVVEVIEEGATQDLLHMAKVSESDFHEPIFTTAYWRIRWLVITLFNTLLASFVISQFELSIQKITALAFLMTINAAMGGNAGMQVVTIMIRSLATRGIREGEMWRAVRKEVLVACVTGAFFSIVLGTIAALWVHDLYLGIVLSVALACNILWAAFAGTVMPIVIHRMGMDPAISAGPILTTTTDVLGYLTFLGFATFFLL